MPNRGTSIVSPSHLAALRSKHALLSLRIEEAQKRPSASDIYVKELKKKRLSIKTRIHIEEQDNLQ